MGIRMYEEGETPEIRDVTELDETGRQECPRKAFVTEFPRNRNSPAKLELAEKLAVAGASARAASYTFLLTGVVIGFSLTRSFYGTSPSRCQTNGSFSLTRPALAAGRLWVVNGILIVSSRSN